MALDKKNQKQDEINMHEASPKTEMSQRRYLYDNSDGRDKNNNRTLEAWNVSGKSAQSNLNRSCIATVHPGFVLLGTARFLKPCKSTVLFSSGRSPCSHGIYCAGRSAGDVAAGGVFTYRHLHIPNFGKSRCLLL